MGVKGCAIHLSFSPGNGVLMRDNTPKSTRTQGGDPIADYIRADTRLPAYLPYPRFLLKMEISQTAKLLVISSASKRAAISGIRAVNFSRVRI